MFQVGDEDEDASSVWGIADADVVEARAAAEGDAAGGVDLVVADFGIGEDGVAVEDGGEFGLADKFS